MTKIPQFVRNEWKKREGPIVFSTVDKNGVPNSIYVTCVAIYDDETILVADNHFDKTKNNILNGSKGSVLFITNERKSYQIKGNIEYHKSGSLFDDMKKWNPKKLSGNAVAAIKAEEIYSGSQKL